MPTYLISMIHNYICFRSAVGSILATKYFNLGDVRKKLGIWHRWNKLDSSRSSMDNVVVDSISIGGSNISIRNSY
ncbi:conserved hypothetical protein [Ricinus communis]|uniref:Uncharacterized protein n=1 Tax=Ricinus communis TaxID=3988 RepID=B9RVJ8_RICCO|nr:conserved hypothetical protein [Ricinus communis]